jgi:hypothetical protein
MENLLQEWYALVFFFFFYSNPICLQKKVLWVHTFNKLKSGFLLEQH